MRRTDAATMFATVDLGEGADARTTNVQMSGDRGATNVEPVRVDWGQFLVSAVLDEVVPGWHLELAGPGKLRFRILTKILVTLSLSLNLN